MRGRDGQARDASSDARQRPGNCTEQHHRKDKADQRKPTHQGVRSDDPIRLELTSRRQAAVSRCRPCYSAAIGSCDFRPTVVVRSLDAVAMEYEIEFFVTNVEQGPDAQTELFDLVFRHCASAGIRLRAVRSPSPLAPRIARQPPRDMPRRLLDHLPIFAPLSEDERVLLAPKMKRRTHKAGDVVVKRGSVAHSLSILSSGVLVAIQDSAAGEEEAMRFAPGDSFGEAGLLTGAATMFTIRTLTKATVYEIAKVDLAPILEERPATPSNSAVSSRGGQPSEKRGLSNWPFATSPTKLSRQGLASA